MDQPTTALPDANEPAAHAPPDRRPIASRDRATWIAATAWLSDRGVSPNAISVGGMIAAIVGGTALAATAWVDGGWQRVLWLIGALGAQLRLIANMLDGMVAIRSGRTSPVGELYNEVPDRVSDVAMLVGLGYAAMSSPVLGYVAAILAVFVAYVRAACRVAGAPQNYCGPMAKPQRMATVTAAGLAMALLPAGWRAIAFGNGWGLPAVALGVIIFGSVVTAVRRIAHARSALVRKVAA